MHGTKACILIRRLLILLEIELCCVGQFDDEQDYVYALMTKSPLPSLMPEQHHILILVDFLFS